MEKEERLFERKIKCLSLFFIDEVVKYRDYSQPDEQGEYAKMFEEEYIKILNEKLTLFETPYLKYLRSILPKDTHKGYFSIDKKSGKFIDSKDNKETGSDDISAYDLILKNKERLLSFDEPTRFIFSHSALREGWDNPNVFQICALKHGGDSPIAKRQEVGRGLRIAVNFIGDRVDYKYCRNERSTFHNVNTLTVIATDSYKDFVSSIQKVIKENLADRPTKATIEYFKGKFITDGAERIEVSTDMASDIRSYLKLYNYISSDGAITEVYRTDVANNSLQPIPENFGLSQYTDSIHKLIQGIFDEKALDDMFEDASTSNREGYSLSDPRIQKLSEIVGKIINTLVIKRNDAGKQVNDEIKAIKEKIDAEAEAERKRREDAEKAKEKAEDKVRKLQAQNNTIFNAITEEQESFSAKTHLVKTNAIAIRNSVSTLAQKVGFNNYKEIGAIAISSDKILSSLKYSALAKFNIEDEYITVDLFKFCKEYLEMVLKKQYFDIAFDVFMEGEYCVRFNPQYMSLILDNFISNSEKANATKFFVTMISKGSSAVVTIEDNGDGFGDVDLNLIFDFGFSNTGGTGIGLYNIKRAVEKMKGTISACENEQGGATFTIEF